MKNEKWDDVHGNTTPDDRMVAFLESPTDSYAILQLREDVDDNIPLMFANYSYLQKKEMEPEIDRYEVVYHGSISMSEDVNRQLEDLYVKFNIDHPDDFRGHSMSVSDIVALKVVGEVSFHYVDSVGFQKLENFMKSENYLKNAEMAMEDDYGMIDGIINNGKASGLEERPSVLEQLKEKPVPDVSHKPPMDFTQDERNMMMLYSPGTRSGLCEALTLMKEQLSEDESELFALADSVLRKVSAMDDAAFEKLNLYPD